MMDFLSMGGYGFYVWGSFGLATAIILFNILEPILHHKKAIQEADDFYTEENK